MKKQLDLGCGSTPRIWDGYKGYGVDIVDSADPQIKKADLAIQEIPFKDNEFDLVTAYDFLEHIPQFIYQQWTLRYRDKPIDTGWDKRNCMIELFNEVYRVLKDGGEFFFAVPMAGTQEFYRDPTHVFPWVQQSLHYFSGDYYGMHDHYGHKSKFKLLSSEVIDGWRLEAMLQAIKPDVSPYEVGEVI